MDVLSTSKINSLVSSFTENEKTKYISPLTSRKTKYQNLSTGYGTLSTKLTALKNLLTSMKLTGSDSIFTTKSATSSNTNFLTATAANTAAAGSSYDLRINQLAKADSVLTSDLTSSTSNLLTGNHSFIVKTGDGEGGEFTSKIDVAFTGSETNKTVLEKLRNAINADKAIITSTTKMGTDNYTGGATSFKININGTETTVNVNGGGTYENLIDELVTNINAVGGVSAEKVKNTQTGEVNLKLTVNDPTKYITITSSGSDIVSDLGITANKEKGASGIISASVFSPSSDLSQLSISAKNTGTDFRIKEISDSGVSNALASIGLNLGTARPQFNQSTAPDTAGFLYSDINPDTNLLNAKIVFNGLNIQRSSNTVSDLVNGMTFNLKAVMQPTDTTVTVGSETDTKAVKTRIEEFITKFNDVYSYIKNNSLTSSSSKGFFSGDTNATSLLSTFSSIAFSSMSGLDANGIDKLTEIGISFNSVSGLSLSDSTKLENKIKEAPSEVEGLFNSENGVANFLFNKIDPYLGASGYLEKSKSNLDTNIKYISDRITSTQARIDKSSVTLRRRYEQLQTQLANLLSTQSMFNFSGTNY